MASNSAVKKVVTVIPVKPLELIKGIPENSKKRIAAYCRVSTDLKEQESSFESQVKHFTDTIARRSDWELVDIYADDGISGTTTTKRTEFLRMINECMAGKIDMIITKSISRFARNTEDCLHFVRKLKDKGIAVYFETENINTLGAGGELLLTILSGMAQDSSRNQSDVTKWGILRQFESGKVIVNTTRFLGYDKNEDGELVINEEQAQQYMVNENHPPIISKEIFDKVQDEKERRALLKGNLVGDRHKYSNKYPFSGKVFCGNCGNIFKRRQWNSTNTSKKVV